MNETHESVKDNCITFSFTNYSQLSDAVIFELGGEPPENVECFCSTWLFFLLIINNWRSFFEINNNHRLLTCGSLNSRSALLFSRLYEHSGQITLELHHAHDWQRLINQHSTIQPCTFICRKRKSSMKREA